MRSVGEAAGRHRYEAEALLRTADETWHAVIGEVHAQQAHALTGLGRIAALRSDRDAAKKYFARATEIRQARLQSDHPDTLSAKIYLATTGDDAKSCAAQARELTEAMRKRVGDIHPKAAHAWLMTAGLEKAGGEFESAKDHFEESARIIRALNLNEHPWLADGLVELSELAAQRGEPQEAAKLRDEAVQIRITCYEPGDRRTVDARKRLKAVRGEQTSQE